MRLVWPAGRPPVGQQTTDIVGQQWDTQAVCETTFHPVKLLWAHGKGTKKNILYVNNMYIICVCLARCLDMKMNVSEHLQAVLHNYKLARCRCFFFLSGGGCWSGLVQRHWCVSAGFSCNKLYASFVPVNFEHGWIWNEAHRHAVFDWHCFAAGRRLRRHWRSGWVCSTTGRDQIEKNMFLVKLAFFARAHCCLDVMQCRTTWFACSIFLLAHYNSYTSGRVPISYFKADQEHLRASTCQCMAPDKAGGGLTRSLELQDCLFRLRTQRASAFKTCQCVKDPFVLLHLSGVSYQLSATESEGRFWVCASRLLVCAFSWHLAFEITSCPACLFGRAGHSNTRTCSIIPWFQNNLW
jgi:hypothetical protein